MEFMETRNSKSKYVEAFNTVQSNGATSAISTFHILKDEIIRRIPLLPIIQELRETRMSEVSAEEKILLWNQLKFMSLVRMFTTLAVLAQCNLLCKLALTVLGREAFKEQMVKEFDPSNTLRPSGSDEDPAVFTGIAYILLNNQLDELIQQVQLAVTLTFEEVSPTDIVDRKLIEALTTRVVEVFVNNYQFSIDENKEVLLAEIPKQYIVTGNLLYRVLELEDFATQMDASIVMKNELIALNEHMLTYLPSIPQEGIRLAKILTTFTKISENVFEAPFQEQFFQSLQMVSDVNRYMAIVFSSFDDC